MLKHVLIAGSALAVAMPVSAQTAPGAEPASVQKSAKDPNKIVCERQEEIGSRLGGKKVCKTVAEWELERQQQRQTIDAVQRQATSTGIPAG